ncbi:MAG: adhesin [Gemmatimonadota bacterium]|nr:MAG: adhesin [Gemmatimonadota bacterium]
MNTLRIIIAWVAFAAVAHADPLHVVCATNDLGAIARAVTGPEARIDVAARPDRDPHAFEVRPSTVRNAGKADIYLEVGLSLDLWSVDVVRGSRNRNLVVVTCADAIQPIEVPTGRVDASMGDVHSEGNPHYWLDPVNAISVARLLAERFAQVDPARVETYPANAEAFALRIEERLPVWRARLEGRSFIEFHRSWGYLAERFSMRIAGRVEPLPGIPPGARHLAALAELIREQQIPLVVRDVYHTASAVEFLARETGVRSAVLPTSCDEPTPEAFLAHFDRVADVLGMPIEGPGSGESR